MECHSNQKENNGSKKKHNQSKKNAADVENSQTQRLQDWISQQVHQSLVELCGGGAVGGECKSGGLNERTRQGDNEAGVIQHETTANIQGTNAIQHKCDRDDEDLDENWKQELFALACKTVSVCAQKRNVEQTPWEFQIRTAPAYFHRYKQQTQPQNQQKQQRQSASCNVAEDDDREHDESNNTDISTQIVFKQQKKNRTAKKNTCGEKEGGGTESLAVVTIVSNLGLQRTLSTPLALAQLLLLSLEEKIREGTPPFLLQQQQQQQLRQNCGSGGGGDSGGWIIRCNESSGFLSMISLERLEVLRVEYGRILCPQCCQFCKGEAKGLWWHLQTQHHHDSANDDVHVGGGGCGASDGGGDCGADACGVIASTTTTTTKTGSFENSHRQATAIASDILKQNERAIVIYKAITRRNVIHTPFTSSSSSSSTALFSSSSLSSSESYQQQSQPPEFCDGGDDDETKEVESKCEKSKNQKNFFDVFQNRMFALVKQGDFEALQRFISQNYSSSLEAPNETTSSHHPRCIIDDKGASLLLWAAGGGNLDMVQYLIETVGCDPHFAQGGTMLTTNVCNSGDSGSPNSEPQQQQQRTSAGKGRQGQRKCRARRAFSGRTALHWAARNGHLPVVQYLVETAHVDVEAATQDGTTAFCWAAWQGHFNVVQYLFESAGCNSNSTNSFGCNASLWAAQGATTSTASLFSSAVAANNNGSSDSNEDQDESLIKIITWLDSVAGCSWRSSVNLNGHSVLHKAAQRGKTKLVDWLLRETWEISQGTLGPNGCHDETSAACVGVLHLIGPDNEGHVPSDLAAMEGHKKLASILAEQEVKLAKQWRIIQPREGSGGSFNDCAPSWLVDHLDGQSSSSLSKESKWSKRDGDETGLTRILRAATLQI